MKRNHTGPFCLIDRDADIDDSQIWRTENLIVTRHACLEMHLYSAATLNAQLQRGFGKKVELVHIEQAELIARTTFALRAVKAKTTSNRPIPEVWQSLVAQAGKITINLDHYLVRYDNKLINPRRRMRHLAQMRKMCRTLAADGRQWMNIHDLELAIEYGLFKLLGIDKDKLGGFGWLPRFIRMDKANVVMGGDDFFAELGQRYHAVTPAVV